MAGGERWFSAIYVKDLVAGLMVAAASTGAAGRVYFLAQAKPVSWTQLGKVAGGIMGTDPRVLRVPVPVAHTAGYIAEVWSRITRKPPIRSREKVSEAD